jgi:AcrR family transcriptional regulator
VVESSARRRVLETASALFYAEGVHAVGIDRIIAEAGVAKATFYHHFPAKDELVRAYLDAEYQRQRTALEAVRQDVSDPRDALVGIFELLASNAVDPQFRGCPFTNAAAEYPDPTHPVRRTIAEYRRWNRGLFRDLLADAGHAEPDGTATMLMMLRDGIVVGGDLDDPHTLRPHVRQAVTRMVRTSPSSATAG